MADTSPKRIKHSQYQSFFLIGLFLFFVGHFLLLNPSSLEDDFGAIRVVEPQNLLAFLKNETKTALEEIPRGEVPAYALRDSIVYASAEDKQSFKLNAVRSNYYQKEQIIHALEVLVTFPDGTTVKANEGIFFTGESKAKFYGQVHTVFATGGTLDSEYAEAFMKPVTQIEIPRSETATGFKSDKTTITHFTSQGLSYKDVSPKTLKLLSDVHVWIKDQKNTTDIYSDRADYEQEAGYLNFQMNESRPLSSQFVKTEQPDLKIKSRTLDLQLEDAETLHFINARGDVSIRDLHDPLKISSSTSGEAVYDVEKNDVILTDFPQVYQEGDTITGDIIIFHRTTDEIEVKQSNAIYNSTSNPKR